MSELYRDPSLYDLEYDAQIDDVMHYVRLAGEFGAPVLELGCGNGRITLPLARTGHLVHGVDIEPRMLADLHRKLEQESNAVARRVTVAQHDFREPVSGRKFPLVILPFNAIHHCTSHREVMALFDGVRQSLADGGRFALDMYLPDPTLYARDPEQRFEPRDFVDPRDGQRIRSWESGRYDPLTQVHTVRYIYRREDGSEYDASIHLRMFYPQEFRALLDWAGFEIVAEAGDFHGAPLQADSLKWVLVMRARD